MTQTGAILCALAAFFGWVVVDAVIKLASQGALSPFMIMAMLGIVGTMAMFARALCKRDLTTLRPLHPRQQAVICLCSMILNYACVIGLKHLPLTIYYVSVFTAPLVIACLVSLLRHEVLTRTKVACLIAGFGGVVIAIMPRLTIGGEWIGYVAACVCVAGFVLYSLTIRKIAATDSPESIQFSTSLSVGVFGITAALLNQETIPATAMLPAMLAAALLNVFANLLYNKALQHTSSTNVAQTHYTQIISGAVIGYLIWHEIPTWNLVVGSLVIVASGLTVAHQARRAEHSSIRSSVKQVS
jgi:drug/metabolite transporter (DMT)-like permease